MQANRMYRNISAATKWASRNLSSYAVKAVTTDSGEPAYYVVSAAGKAYGKRGADLGKVVR